MIIKYLSFFIILAPLFGLRLLLLGSDKHNLRALAIFAVFRVSLASTQKTILPCAYFAFKVKKHYH